MFLFSLKTKNGPENMFGLLFENTFIKNAFRMRPTFEKIKKVVFYISVFMLTKKKFQFSKFANENAQNAHWSVIDVFLSARFDVGLMS